MTSLQTGPSRFGMHLLAIPTAVTIITFLGYSSQWLFATAHSLDPGPLSPVETVVFNGLLACLWWTYFRACTVDPGRYVFEPTDADADADAPLRKLAAAANAPLRRASSASSASSASTGSSSHAPTAGASPSMRWCKKCNAPKPPRAHHCRHCRRCIPKMDHHCPWTGNCVSMQTFPHFLRFVVFTNASLWMLLLLIARRFYALYAQRHLPAYLGPTLPQLVHLAILGLLCAATLLALTIMLYTTVQAWMFNTTMIEGWEVERHEAVVERYRSSSSDGTWWGDDMDDDDDDDDEDDDDNGYGRLDRKGRKAAALRMRIEFPYDLGIFDNMAQAMGTRNALMWLVPLAGEPRLSADGSGLGWHWPENGFNDRTGMWPPPDPEKQRYAAIRSRWGPSTDTSTAPAFASGCDADGRTPEDEKAAFRARQEADLRRRHGQMWQQQQKQQQNKIASRSISPVGDDSDFEEGMDGEPGWTNADGDRLRDYGVDEEAENDEDVPLAALLQRRRAWTNETQTAAKGSEEP